MLNSAKRQDLETEAMWSVKVRWTLIMTPRFLAVLDGTRDNGATLIPMVRWMLCVAGKTISSVLVRCSGGWWFFIHVDISARQSEIRAETVVSSGGKDRNTAHCTTLHVLDQWFPNFLQSRTPSDIQSPATYPLPRSEERRVGKE